MTLASLALDPRNARKHGERNLDSIEASLRRFGQQKPIVVDADGVIVAGNGTFAAAKALGWKSIDVVRTKLRGPEARAFAISDNRTGELAEWDAEELVRQLESLKSEEIPLEVVGFDAAELEKMSEELAAAIAGPLEPEKEKNFGPARGENQPRLDQRKPVKCPHCGEEFVPPKS